MLVWLSDGDNEEENVVAPEPKLVGVELEATEVVPRVFDVETCEVEGAELLLPSL